MRNPLSAQRLTTEPAPDEPSAARPLPWVAPFATGSPWPSTTSAGRLHEEAPPMPAATDSLTRALIRTGKRLVVVRFAEVDWIEAAGNYVHLHSSAACHRYRRTLDALESRVDPRRFVRIHRSTIVNVERVAELCSTGSGSYDVVLRDGKRLPLSRSYKKRLFAMLGKE